MQNRNMPTRVPRRPETQPPESDVAAIFERRLLARGIRSDDFLDWRGSSDLPAIPAITPIQFGRGCETGDIRPMAIVDPAPAEPVSAPAPDEPDPSDESGSN